ncbi:hypothetical protein BFW01_g7544 [Lasiodiplodia theobromae]|nr:hypothetical protein BFW01_g7544 [Lasiodiplodia theobromae]
MVLFAKDVGPVDEPLSSLASGSLSSLSSLSSDSPPPEAAPTSIIHITVGGNVRAEVKTSGPARIIFVSKSGISSDDYLDDTYTAPTTVFSARAGSGHPEVSTTCPNWIVIDTAPVANEEDDAEGGSAEESDDVVVVLD